MKIANEILNLLEYLNHLEIPVNNLENTLSINVIIRLTMSRRTRVNPMQDQIDNLSAKLDTLQGAVDGLNARLSDTLSALQVQPYTPAGIAVPVPEEALQPQPTYPTMTPQLHNQGHKDILADDAYIDIDSSYTERSLTPEIQTQRLMAQLTAAYNRIAALEEQLLDCRINTH